VDCRFMGRPGIELRRWNSLRAHLVPVAEDDRESLKISPCTSPMRGPASYHPTPDACESLTCEEPSLSETSEIIPPAVVSVTSATLRLGLPAVPHAAVFPIGGGSVTRALAGTAGLPRVLLNARGDKNPAGLGNRSLSLGSGLSLLRARRPSRCATTHASGYASLMPLVLHALGRLRYARANTSTECVSIVL